MQGEKKRFDEGQSELLVIHWIFGTSSLVKKILRTALF
jgi:hypothetical protein